jgi:hypothetical protein
VFGADSLCAALKLSQRRASRSIRDPCSGCKRKTAARIRLALDNRGPHKGSPAFAFLSISLCSLLLVQPLPEYYRNRGLVTRAEGSQRVPCSPGVLELPACADRELRNGADSHYDPLAGGSHPDGSSAMAATRSLSDSLRLPRRSDICSSRERTTLLVSRILLSSG